MSRRSLPTLAAAAVCALALSGCGEQTPGGLPAEGQQAAGSTAAGSTAAAPLTAQGGASDENDPIVVKIGEQEFATNMAIYRRYDEAKGGPLALQAPVAPAEELVGGKKQDFVSGTIYWSAETGAQIVRGQILATYLDNGGPTGQPSWPVGDETIEGHAAESDAVESDAVEGGAAEGGVIFSDFQRGQIRVENQAIRVIEHTS